MENKHTQEDLKILQALPLDVKIRKTQIRIQEWYEQFNGQVYVSRSGGKDSDVLGDIVKKLYPDVPHVFVNTGLEFTSVMKHGSLVSDKILKPIIRFDDVLIKFGYPIISKRIAQYANAAKNNPDCVCAKYLKGEIKGTIFGGGGRYAFLINAPFKISNQCCYQMKKNPIEKYAKEINSRPIIGTMANESSQRKNKWIKFGCNAFNGKYPISQPLSFWTEQDILHYIKLYKIEIASAYGDIVYTDKDGMQYDNDIFNADMKLTTTGESRTGCVFCMFGIIHDTERFVRLKEREPKKYDYVMRGGKFEENGMWIPHNGLGYKFIIDWLNENGGFNIKY